MLNTRSGALGLVIACALLSMSCISPCYLGLGARNRAPTATPLPTVPPSESAASSFEEKARAFEDSTFRVEFTDQEVTSYLALHLPDSVPLSSPRVAFQPGQFTVEGDLTAPVRGHLVLSGTISVDAGKPQVIFQSARVAGVTLPQAMLGSLSDSIAQMILEDAPGVQLEQVELLAGRIVIAGRNSATP